MKIYEVIGARFTDEEDYCYVHRLNLDEYTAKYCTIDSETNMATDLITGQQFLILKKDENNRILGSEASKIYMNEYYGLSVKKANMNGLSINQKMQILRGYLKYDLLNNPKEQKQKTKKR